MTPTTEDRISRSFQAQGLMATLALVADGELHIALPFSPAISQQHRVPFGALLGRARKNPKL